MGQVWTTHGIRIDYERTMYYVWNMIGLRGIYLEYVLNMHEYVGTCMTYAWKLNARFVEYEWNTYRICTDYEWNMYRI